MALDGGGGGGPVGIANSFTGPSQQIEIAGDFAYGYSGEIIINNSYGFDVLRPQQVTILL